MTFSNYSVYYINIINLVDIKLFTELTQMKLTAKVQYAYKAILELALHYDSKAPIQINAIARVQGIPRQFLIQLLIRLKNAGLVKSVRGMEGGYLLTRAPSEINLAHVISAVGDNILVKPNPVKLDDGSGRIFMKICDEISKRVISNLQEETFDNLILKFKSENLSYSI